MDYGHGKSVPEEIHGLVADVRVQKCYHEFPRLQDKSTWAVTWQCNAAYTATVCNVHEK